MILAGTTSLRFDTDGGFDCALWYPEARDASWNLTGVERLTFAVWADNQNLGFQNSSPWIRLGSAGGYFQYQTDHDLLNDARSTWLPVAIPLAGDATWIRTVSGSPDLASIDYVEIHADTWDYGFTLWIDDLDFDTGSNPVSGVGDGTSGNPATLAFGPGSPNPFGSQTQLALDLPRQKDAWITVYDVAGRRVRELFVGAMAAGRHVVVWDGRDDGGRRVGSGVYFVRLATDAGVIQRKVVYIGS